MTEKRYTPTYAVGQRLCFLALRLLEGVVTISDIQRDLGVSEKTARRYLRALEAVFDGKQHPATLELTLDSWGRVERAKLSYSSQQRRFSA